MHSCYIVGAFSTPFGKHPDQSYFDLTESAVRGVLTDAGLVDGLSCDSIWFGNCTLSRYGQLGIRGQVCTGPLKEKGLLPERIPTINVENGCATSSAAFHAACREIQSGHVNLSLVIGVEKLFDPSRADLLDVFGGFFDALNPTSWRDCYESAASLLGRTFERDSGRAVTMDTYALQACYHMATYGTTQQQIAQAAAKTHGFAADNPNAHYRRRLRPDDVISDRIVSYPLTRSMCAPITDGAAALLVCSGAVLADLGPRQRDRAVRVAATALVSGKRRTPEEPGLSQVAAQRAYLDAGLRPEDVDVAEVHDATSFSEIYQAEMLGFCPIGQGGPFVASGATGLGGSIPTNTSGGLIGKGHPIGATGASMLAELVTQLRGEAGPRQVKGARIGLAENGGGVLSFDEAACVVALMERA